jgi:predicted DsbA family dithiol-disulfide isomerase
MPFELRPYPTPTLDPKGDYLQNAWSQNVLPLAQRMGVTMRLPDVQPYTHLAFEGYQFAKEHGKGNEYNHRMFTAFFQESQDLANIDVLTNLAVEIGLPEAEYRAALENRTYREAHQHALAHAYNEAKINVVPTFIIGEQVLRGLYGAESLTRIINEEAQGFPEGLACDVDGNC